MKVRLTLRLHGDSLGGENVVLEVNVLGKVGLTLAATGTVLIVVIVQVGEERYAPEYRNICFSRRQHQQDPTRRIMICDPGSLRCNRSHVTAQPVGVRL